MFLSYILKFIPTKPISSSRARKIYVSSNSPLRIYDLYPSTFNLLTFYFYHLFFSYIIGSRCMVAKLHVEDEWIPDKRTWLCNISKRFAQGKFCNHVLRKGRISIPSGLPLLLFRSPKPGLLKPRLSLCLSALPLLLQQY